MQGLLKRSSRVANFTTVNNDFLQDKKLSWKAKGLIVYIMSLPLDWSVNIADLSNRSKDGRESTNSGIKELISLGYCRKTVVRKDGKFESVEYEISDIKEFEAETPQTGKPQTENPFMVCEACKPQTGKPFTGNSQLINTKYNKDYINNIDIAVEKKNKSKKTLFRNSDVYKFADLDKQDYSLFASKFEKLGIDNLDFAYYFNAVSDWSDSSDTKRTYNGWMATVRKFIRSDKDKNKLRLVNNTPKQLNEKSALDYLNM